jgi:3-hydroxyisobutyrate dehydrogenase
MSTLQRVGFIGLGMMGMPMARCLLKAGFELCVAAADESRVQALTADRRAHRLEFDHACSLQALITMLPNSDIVEGVLLDGGAQSWARRLPQGATVIDMGSSHPSRSRQFGETLTRYGVDYLDAPVSGGVGKAQSGALAILVGGDAVVLERCRPLLRAMGRSVVHVGPAGSGHAAKALNNYVSAASLLATVEALHIATRFGIDPASMTSVLNACTGHTHASEHQVQQFMLSGTFASGLALQLLDRDLQIAQTLGRAVKFPMRFGEACAAIWSAAASACNDSTDHTEIYRLLADGACDRA